MLACALIDLGPNVAAILTRDGDDALLAVNNRLSDDARVTAANRLLEHAEENPHAGGLTLAG